MSWLVYDLCSRHRGPTYAITGTKSTPHCGICVVDVHRSSCAAQRRHSCVSDASRLVRENERGRRTSRDGHARSCIPSFPVRAPSNTHPHCLVLVRREARRDGQRSKATSPNVRTSARERSLYANCFLQAGSIGRDCPFVPLAVHVLKSVIVHGKALGRGAVRLVARREPAEMHGRFQEVLRARRAMRRGGPSTPTLFARPHCTLRPSAAFFWFLQPGSESSLSFPPRCLSCCMTTFTGFTT